MDAFISHASQDIALAETIEEALERDGHSAWLDRSEIRLGALLRDELVTAIRGCCVVVLLWSKSAARSRWVASEILTAYHLGRFIVPCSVDTKPLPQFLQHDVHLDLRNNAADKLKILCRAVREAPRSANSVPPPMSHQNRELQEVTRALAHGQRKEMDCLLDENLKVTREVHGAVDGLMREAEKRWPFDSMILNLAGYHRKNAYMLKHWDAIQAGRAPQDQLLLRAERRFFEALFVNPTDPSGLDGLGSVLMLEHELDAAEFFFTHAIAAARHQGGEYAEAQQNLALIRSYKQRPVARRATRRRTTRVAAREPG